MLGGPEEEGLAGSSVAGVDFDSSGRAFADVTDVNSIGKVTTGRRQLTEDEVNERLADQANAQNAQLIAEAEEAIALQEQMAAGELPGLGDPSLGGAGGPVPLGGFDVSRPQTEADQAQLKNINAQLSATTTTRSPEPKYPIVQEQHRNLVGSADPLPIEPWRPDMVDPSEFVPFDPEFDEQAMIAEFKPPPREEGEDMESWQLRAADEMQQHKLAVSGEALANRFAKEHNDELLKRSKAEYELKVAEIRELTASSNDPEGLGLPGHKSVLQAEMDVAKEGASATLDQAQTVAELQAETAKISRKGHEALADEIAAADERIAEQEKAMANLSETRAAAQERAEAMPAPDRKRFFKNMTGGQRFWAVLGAIGGGLAGSSKSVQMLYQLAESDYREQVDAVDKAQSEAHLADSEISSARGIFRDMRAALNDKVSLKHEWIAMQLDDAARTIEAEIARTNVPIVKAELEKMLIGVRRKSDLERQASELRVATTPRFNVSTRASVRGPEREVLEDTAKQLRGDVSAAKKREPGLVQEEGKVGAKLAEDRRKEAKADARQAEQDKRLNLQGEGGITRQAAKATDKAFKHVAVVDRMDKFLRKYEGQNIAGRGASAFFATEEGRTVRAEIEANLIDVLFANSGANVPESEFERDQKRIVQGWGDEELMRNVHRELERAAGKVKATLVPLTDEARAHFMSGLEREGFNTARYGATGKSAAEVAAELGGEVR